MKVSSSSCSTVCVFSGRGSFGSFIAAWLLSVLAVCDAQAQTIIAKWNVNANGNWGTGTSWAAPNVVPNAAGDTANLSFNISGTRVVTLDINPTIGTLILGDTNNTNAFVIGAGMGLGTLTFDNLGAGALLNHNSGTAGISPNGGDRIDANVTLADAGGLTIDLDRNIEFRGAWDGGGNDVTILNSNAASLKNNVRAFWNANSLTAAQGILSNVNVLNINNGEARFDGIAGTADGQLIGANTINLGTGTLETDGKVFPRLLTLNTETTQTATLNINGGWFLSDLGNIDDLVIWSGNINFTGPAASNIVDVNDAGTADTHIVTGVLGGTGGFSKVNAGTLQLTADNTVGGNIYIQRGGVGGTGVVSEGGIRLTGADGAFSALNSLTISRDGSLYLDNSTDINGDRVNNAAPIALRAQGRLRLIGNAAGAVSETFGALTQEIGSGKVNFDLDDTTPMAVGMTFASYSRNPGSITQFQVLDNITGTFGSPLGGLATLNITDMGAAATLYGGAGVDGSSTKPIVVGAFGGVNNISNHFMTFDVDNPTELRPLVWDGTTVGSEYLLSREQLTVAHQFDRASLGSVDQNVLINFNVDSSDGQIGTGLPGSGSDYGWYGKAPVAILENVAMNSLRFGTNTTTSGNNTNEIGSTLVLAPGARLFLGDKAADAQIGAITNSGSGMILFGRDITGTAPGSNQFIAGGFLDFGTREAIIVNESGNSAFFRSNIVGTGGLTKAGANNIYLDNSNSYYGVTTLAEGLLDVRDQQHESGRFHRWISVPRVGNQYSGHAGRRCAPGSVHRRRRWKPQQPLQ